MQDEQWYADLRQLLEEAYLATDNPRGQSGFGGDEARWQLGRGVIAEAIDRDGSFLDIGCASGLLMETLVRWAGDRGYVVEPYGLDISEKLADLARSRLTAWADRIYVGNAMTWEPPRRFDFVRTEIVYVPDGRRREYVARLLETVVAPGGRLIACSYGSSRDPTNRAGPIADHLRDWGYQVAGEAEAVDPANGMVIARVAWVDAWP